MLRTKASRLLFIAIAACLCSWQSATAQNGACCIDGECSEISPVFCSATGGIYLGEGTTCENDGFNCDLGACCTGEGCIETSQIDCAQQGGLFEVGATCTENLCGACCTFENQCLDTTSIQCANMDGATFFPGTTCESEPCGPPPTGACCDNGACFDGILEAACVSGGRIWAGPNTTCADQPAPCTEGACCVNSNCVQLIPSDCASQGGAFFGGACTSGLCAPPSGACCSGTNCVVTIPENCTEELGRVFLGDGTTCEGDPCGPGGDPTGACCTAEFGCLNDVTSAQCDASGGLYAGNDTTCSSGTCDLGACCRGATCTVEFQLACVQVGGDFQGSGTNCDGFPCGAPPVGACCRFDGSCENDVAANACTGSDTWLGAGTVCTAGSCSSGACCTDSGCQDVSETECQSINGFFFAGADCASGACNAGACCLDGACGQAPAYNCILAGRDFFGAGVPCDPNPCLPCATCHGDANGDNAIDGDDVQAMTDCLLGADPLQCKCSDMNQDGNVDLGDVNMFVTAVLAGGLCE